MFERRITKVLEESKMPLNAGEIYDALKLKGRISLYKFRETLGDIRENSEKIEAVSMDNIYGIILDTITDKDILNGFQRRFDKSKLVPDYYYTLKGKKDEAVKNKVAQTLKEHIKDAKIQVSEGIEELGGRKPYSFLDEVMNFMTSKSSEFNNSLLKEFDRRMKKSLKKLKEGVDYVESAKEMLERIQHQSWASEFNQDLDVFAKFITPEIAHQISSSYAQACVNEDEKALSSFYETLQKTMGFSDEIKQALLKESQKGKSGNEAHIMSTLEYETKDAEARSAIKAVHTAVFNIMRSAERW